MQNNILDRQRFCLKNQRFDEKHATDIHTEARVISVYYHFYFVLSKLPFAMGQTQLVEQLE